MARLLLLSLVASLAFVGSHSGLAAALESEMRIASSHATHTGSLVRRTNPSRRQEQAPSREAQIVDNSNPRFTTTGDTANCNRSGGYNGTHCRGKKNDRFNYRFNNDSGRYDIYAYYPEYWLAHTTYFDVNNKSITVDQRKNGSQWVWIETLDLPEDVVITGRTNSYNNGNFDALAIVAEGGEAPDGSLPRSSLPPEPAATEMLREPSRKAATPSDILLVASGKTAANDAAANATIPKSIPAQLATKTRLDAEPTAPPPEVGEVSTFMDRCADPNVVFCDPLSTHGPYGKDDNGELVVLANPDESEGIPNHTWWHKWRGVQQWGENTAGYDTELDALKLVMTDTRGSSGVFTTNFSKDLKTQFGEGDSFRIEFQVRYNCEYIYVDCDSRSPTFKTDRRPIINKSNKKQGAKIAIIGEGDVKQGESANACERIQIVPHTSVGHTLQGFHHCGKYAGFDKSTGKSVQGSKQIDTQAGGEYRCLRFPDNATRTSADWSADGTGPNCAYIEADEWMTFAMEVDIGEWQNQWSGPPKSRVRFFLAGEGKPLREVINLPRHLSGPDSRYLGYGKIWLQVHSTKAKTNIGRPPIVAWYRHLLVSRK